MTINGPTHLIAPSRPPAPTRPPAVAPSGPLPETSPVRADTTPPSGTSPELWALLTPEERTFFGNQLALGPLTYGRRPADHTAPPAPRGQRIDLRA